MTPKKHGRLYSIIMAGVVSSLLLCCGGFGYVRYRSAQIYVESYDQTTSPTLNGRVVNVRVLCFHRIKSSWRESLVGPPYCFYFGVHDATGKATKARLHSLRIIGDDGNEVPVAISQGESVITNGSALLIAGIEQGDLGTQPQLMADIELGILDGSVREELTISLRRRMRATLRVPGA